jgi:transposase
MEVVDPHRRNGIPIGWAVDGANRNDSVMLEPTLDDAAARGLLCDIETIWLDRGYDSDVTRERLAARLLDDAVIAKKRKKGEAKVKNPQPMGMRWPVERTNAWFAAYGQLRRNTDRKTVHRLAQLALAVTFMLTAKLIDYRNRWSPPASSSACRSQLHTFVQPSRNFHRPTPATGCMQCVPWPTGFS